MAGAMNNYTMVVAWSDEDACFVARFLDFPGLSGLGETVAVAASELQTALELAIETYEEENWPLPEPRPQHYYSGQFRVRLPRSLHATLAEQAELEGVSLNALVTAYLSEKAGVVVDQAKSLRQ